MAGGAGLGSAICPPPRVSSEERRTKKSPLTMGTGSSRSTCTHPSLPGWEPVGVEEAHASGGLAGEQVEGHTLVVLQRVGARPLTIAQVGVEPAGWGAASPGW